MIKLTKEQDAIAKRLQNNTTVTCCLSDEERWVLRLFSGQLIAPSKKGGYSSAYGRQNGDVEYFTYRIPKNAEWEVISEPKSRTWTFEEAPLSLKVKHKESREHIRAEFFTNCVKLYDTPSRWCTVSLQFLHDHYVQLDGSPCGVVEANAELTRERSESE